MSEIKVNSIKGVAASVAALSINNTDGTCTANITNNLSNRNLIINGAMQVAQRGTSYTGANAYTTVDRFKLNHTGLNEDCTTAQADVASGTTPYTNGFRKSFKVTNGNQSAGAGADDVLTIITSLEAQDIANSGWNYTSSSSFITLQFWVKSSVAQNFYGRLQSIDGTKQNYPFETGSLSADTWTKVTKTIPGNSNLQFDNDVNKGLVIDFIMFRGTNTTGSVSLNAWGTYSSSTNTPDNTSTWYTTNDATFEITGVQLEVGSVATDFEHRSFAQELQLCARYYQKIAEGNSKAIDIAYSYNAQYADFVLHYPMGAMRTTPSLDQVNGADYYNYYTGTQGPNLDGAFVIEHGEVTQANVYFDPDEGLTPAQSGYLKTNNSAAYLAVTAEL